MTNVSELLKNLNNLATLTGKISDVHERNLKLYPYVFFNGVTEAKIEYNLAHHHDVQEDLESNKLIVNKPIFNPLVSYYLEIDEIKNDDLDKRYLALSQAVKTLLWSDVKTEIYFNGNIKYKG